MAEKPWIKWFTSDFLNGVGAANLKADEIGVYAVILSLMADRGAPIEDDRAWIAGKSGTSTRRAGIIIDKLVGMGKLRLRAGLIGNARMMREISKRDGKSDQARAAALARWHGDEQPELDLGPDDAASRARARTERSISGDLSPGKTGDNPPDKIPIKSHNRRKSAISDDADASPPCAREESQRSESRITSQPDSNPDSRDGDAELKALYDQACEAAALTVQGEVAIERAWRTVRQWRDAGYDFGAVVIPQIKAMVARSDEPTRLLSRFTPQIKLAHAKHVPPTPPPKAVYEFEGEDARIVPMRRELHALLGDWAYGHYLNRVRFRILSPEDMGDDARTPVEITGDYVPKRAVADMRARILPVLKRHGFSDLW